MRSRNEEISMRSARQAKSDWDRGGPKYVDKVRGGGKNARKSE